MLPFWSLEGFPSGKLKLGSVPTVGLGNEDGLGSDGVEVGLGDEGEELGVLGGVPDGVCVGEGRPPDGLDEGGVLDGGCGICIFGDLQATSTSRIPSANIDRSCLFLMEPP
ncbi:MAG TPA: hypothetical protein QF517_00260 [Pseudomonadales bacterium]|nr:hypothetical protein [Pseudomonadales bacterium]